MFKILIGIVAVACAIVGGAVMTFQPASIYVTGAASFAFAGGLSVAMLLLVSAGRQPVKQSILRTTYSGSPILHRGGTLETATRALSGDLRHLGTDASKTPTSFVVGDKTGSHLQVRTEPQPDGTVKITVVAVGYSGSQFKQRIRPRLASVRPVKWQHPTNLGEGKRQMEGVISGLPGAAIAAITGINA